MPGSMLGDNLLPDAVQSRRRQLRSRVEGLRQPIRQRRQNIVPGPDVVGRLEDTVTGLRNKAVDRDAVLARIRERRADSGGSGTSDGTQNTSDSNNNSGSDSTNTMV